MIDNTVFCSGFWDVTNNSKRSMDHYKEFLPGTIKMLSGGRLVFFHDGGWIKDAVGDLAHKYDVSVEFVLREIPDLPMRQQADKFVRLGSLTDLSEIEKHAKKRIRKEKGLKHYHRELKESGEDAYRDLLSVWFSKAFLVNEVSAMWECDEAHNFAWVDASISRFSQQRKNWKFTECSFSRADRLYHYPSKLRYWGKPLPINASFMLGRKKVWDDVCSYFLAELDRLSETPYPHDEETVLGSIWYRNRHLFESMDTAGYRQLRLEIYRLRQRALSFIGG